MEPNILCFFPSGICSFIWHLKNAHTTSIPFLLMDGECRVFAVCGWIGQITESAGNSLSSTSICFFAFVFLVFCICINAYRQIWPNVGHSFCAAACTCVLWTNHHTQRETIHWFRLKRSHFIFIHQVTLCHSGMVTSNVEHFYDDALHLNDDWYASKNVVATTTKWHKTNPLRAFNFPNRFFSSFFLSSHSTIHIRERKKNNFSVKWVLPFGHCSDSSYQIEMVLVIS